MLQITESAAGLLKQVRADNNLPESAALRIQPVDTPQHGQADIGFTFTSGPESQDQTITDQPDLHVYVAPELATPLSEAVLDTVETPGGTELQLRVEGSGHEGHDHSGHDHSGHDHSGHDHP
jgi:Fe-S cluster assembly iron-binding protein IscA